MRILTVASEAVPFAKTGGLADVIGALPVALSRLGHHVDVVMPRYRGITAGERTGTVTVRLGGQVADAGIWIAGDPGPERLATAPGSGSDDLHRAAGLLRSRLSCTAPSGQDYPDNPERFAFLATPRSNGPRRHQNVSTSFTRMTGRRVSCRCCCGPGARRRRSPHMPAVFTIHNLAYQGVFDASWLPRLGLGWDLMRIDALEYWGRISYLKGGLMFSRHDYDRQPALRTRNSDAGVRFRLRRDPAVPQPTIWSGF